MNAISRKRIAARKRHLQNRLDKNNYPDDLSRPVIRGSTLQFELAARGAGTGCGGIGLLHPLVRELGLAEEIDRRLQLFKVHLPYHESDHVLNLAYNVLCGGTCLEDLELRRQDAAIALCREAGFRKILMRGDTDFSQTRYLDRWHEQPDVQFVFGLDVTPTRHMYADDLPNSAWKSLKRPAKYTIETKPRTRPQRVKERIVEERQFKNIQLVDEEVAEMEHRPVACQHTYRLVIVRKNLRVSEPQQGRLFDDYRYFFYITNDRDSTPQEIVFSANDRCQQENVIAQLAAVRALHAPVNDLLSNGAYMLMTALAWNLKAWLALSLEVKPSRGHAEGQAQKSKLLGLEFRTFVNYFLRIPAQVVKTGRRIVIRLLAYNTWLPTFFRLSEQFARPRRC